MAALYLLDLGAGESVTLKLRLADMEPLGAMDSNSPMVGAINAPGHAERAEGVPGTNDFGAGFDDLFARRQKEADAFYASRIPKELSEDAKLVMRQAFAGMMWNKQFYHYDVRTWLDGDPAGPPPPKERLQGRNHDWTHLYTDDVLSMPDKWEYPWFAAWDLAFHTIPIALIDPDFAKDQLILLLRASACVGGLSGLQNREALAWSGGSRIPGKSVSQAAAKFHLVGEPQRSGGHEYFRGRISGARQYRSI